MKLIKFIENFVYTSMMATIFIVWLMAMFVFLFHGNLMFFAMWNKFGLSVLSFVLWMIVNLTNATLMFLYYRETKNQTK